MILLLNPITAKGHAEAGRSPARPSVKSAAAVVPVEAEPFSAAPAVEPPSSKQISRIFLPIQRYARRLQGLPARDVTRVEALAAIKELAKASSFDPTLVDPLKGYLRAIINESYDATLIDAATTTLSHLNTPSQ